MGFRFFDRHTTAKSSLSKVELFDASSLFVGQSPAGQRKPHPLSLVDAVRDSVAAIVATIEVDLRVKQFVHEDHSLQWRP